MQCTHHGHNSTLHYTIKLLNCFPLRPSVPPFLSHQAISINLIHLCAPSNNLSMTKNICIWIHLSTLAISAGIRHKMHKIVGDPPQISALTMPKSTKKLELHNVTTKNTVNRRVKTQSENGTYADLLSSVHNQYLQPLSSTTSQIPKESLLFDVFIFS